MADKNMDAVLQSKLSGISDSYDDFIKGVLLVARKTQGHQKIIDFIEQCNPSSSDVIDFLDRVDPSIPKPYVDPHICPVCGKHTFDEYNCFEICPVCGWEDDRIQEKNPDYRGGANKMSLNEARTAYKEDRKII